MMVARNKHMATVFAPSWILCLDKSMFILHNMLMCPGWVFCPKKAHPFFNEHHIVCFAKSGILTQIELIEGKDCPNMIEAQNYNNKGKTVRLLLQKSQNLIPCCYDVLDSGFCVLEGDVEPR